MIKCSCALGKFITILKGKTIAHDLHSAWVADILSSEINLLPASQEHVQQALTVLGSMGFLSPRSTASDMRTKLMFISTPTLD